MKTLSISIDEWISSPRIASMDALEERGYLRMLLYAARQEDCGLPREDTALAEISLLGRQWYKPTREKSKRTESGTSGEKLRTAFFERSGRLYSEALLRDWEHQTHVEIARRRAGQIGNARRWGNRTVKVSQEGIANGSQVPSRFDPSHGNRPNAEVPDNAIYSMYQELVARWPEDKRGVDLGAQLWISLVDAGEITEASVGELFAGLERWKESELWRKDNGKYIPALANPQGSGWLQKRAWKDHPKPAGEDF
jgi:hypothetical protein